MAQSIGSVCIKATLSFEFFNFRFSMLQFALLVASAFAKLECSSLRDLWVTSGGDASLLIGQNCCEWTGVVCSKTQHAVTEVNWNNQNLQAMLTAEQFYYLQSMKKL